jgi:lipopolysaccharide transport system ATP-binding protein
MDDVAIRVENLSKRYRLGATRYQNDTLRDQLVDFLKTKIRSGGQGCPATGILWALKDVSFEVKRGEVLGLIGHNGAGKSTLLKVLSRITEPTAGRAEIFGRVGSLLEVGTGFDRELTGRENIYLSGAILGMRKAEIDRKFDEIVAFSEVEKFIDTPVKRYSSGMYVRLAFAVAAHLESEILLVDEVLAVGDAAFQKKCIGKIDDVTRKGRTVLFVSHNMATLEHLCPGALLFDGGRLVQAGSSTEVIQAYLSTIPALARLPLEDRRDRKGEGEVVVTDVKVVNRYGQDVQNAVSGEDVIFRVCFRAEANKHFKNCRISLSAHKDDRCYFLLSTELVSKLPLEIRGSGHIDFLVPKLPLSTGTYHFTTFVESGRVIQDWVVGAAGLFVVDGDYYGTGRNYPDGWAGKCVLVDFSWSLGSHASGYTDDAEQIV